MAERGQTWQRRIEAAQAAIALLDDAGLDQTRPVDVFGLCERLGLWLAFMPLENALGAFVPQGSGGVLITTQRPITVQRYTAGHEIGHWRLGHGAVADDHDRVFGASSAERERLAQIFAANLLMPPPLVLSILERVRSSSTSSIGAAQCYALAREAGVSYEAAVRQLLNLGQLTGPEASELFRSRPLAIKTEITHGRRPINGWADVWPVDEHWDDQVLSLRVEDEAVISLPENRTTGYRWMLADEPTQVSTSSAPAPFAAEIDEQRRVAAQAEFLDELRSAPERRRAPNAILKQLRDRAREEGQRVENDVDETSDFGVDIVGDDYVPGRAPSASARDARALRLATALPSRESDDADSQPIESIPRAGSTGRRLVGVRFGQPGAHTVRLAYRSPYRSSVPIEQYALHAVVEPRRNAFSIEQVADDTDDESWVSEVHQRQLTASPPPLDPDDPSLAE